MWKFKWIKGKETKYIVIKGTILLFHFEKLFDWPKSVFHLNNIKSIEKLN